MSQNGTGPPSAPSLAWHVRPDLLKRQPAGRASHQYGVNTSNKGETVLELAQWQHETNENRRLLAAAKAAQATFNDPEATWGEQVDAAIAILDLRPQLEAAAGRIRSRLER